MATKNSFQWLTLHYEYFYSLFFSASWTPDSFRVAYLPSKWHNLVEMLGLNAARESGGTTHLNTRAWDKEEEAGVPPSFLWFIRHVDFSLSQFLKQGCRRRPGSFPHRYSMKKSLQGIWMCWTGKCRQSLWQEVFSSPDCSTNDALETDILLSWHTGLLPGHAQIQAITSTAQNRHLVSSQGTRGPPLCPFSCT